MTLSCSFIFIMITENTLVQFCTIVVTDQSTYMDLNYVGLCSQTGV